MWYILTNSILAALVLIDATKRQVKSPPMWGLATFLFGPITLAVYLSRRPLLADETRTGGLLWNYARNFTIIWSLLMLLLAISELFHLNEGDGIMQMTLRWAGLDLGTKVGLLMHAQLWLLPIAVVSVAGLLFRRRRIVEIGPTGPLAWSMPGHDTPVSGNFIIGASTR